MHNLNYQTQPIPYIYLNPFVFTFFTKKTYISIYNYKKLIDIVYFIKALYQAIVICRREIFAEFKRSQKKRQ